MDPVQAPLKVVAVSALIWTWFKFTKEVFKFSWQIISSSPDEETYKAVSKVCCQECNGFFNGESDEDGKFICFTCQGLIR